MPEEWFDIVDSADRVVGRARRAEVHAQGFWHRAIHVLVFSGEGKIFLQRRSWKKDLSPGLWDAACSGHVDSGEDYDTAARRELGEEIGLEEASPARWFKMPAGPETGWEFIWVYRLQNDGPFVLNPDEIIEGKWMTKAELAEKILHEPGSFTRPFREIWARTRTLVGSGEV